MSLVARATLAVASITLALVGCRDSTAPNDAARSLGVRPSISRVPADAAPLDSHIVAPRTTDPAINRALAPHYVWLDRTARSNRKLLVFMPGANNQPVGWRLLEKEAARMGYHVIGLMYQNDVAVVEKCNGSDDALCSENMRLEVLDGVDRTDRVDVSPANSIDNRLTKLLVWLDENYAHEGWSQFLEDGAPDWRRIVVSGQSQGAGQAALIGKLRRVDRVVMFSGPPDATEAGIPDHWVGIGETPASKYFALFHDQDHNGMGIRANLEGLDLLRFGDSVRVECDHPSVNDPTVMVECDVPPPYDDTHMLFTDLKPTKGYARPNPHQSTARDDNTPIGADGRPRLRAAWRYLLGAHDGDDETPDD